MLYNFFKTIFKFALRTYFNEIQIRNDENIPSSGPVVLLPNHRSALMDPIIIACFCRRKVYFLARGESFKKPILAKLLGKLNAIPIYRKDKSPDDMSKNEDTFDLCYQLLEKNGVIILFPEGASQSKPILLPLKTGAARIVLGAEAQNNFTLNIQMIPIGINYTNPHHFQGNLFLNVGKPLSAVKYKNDYAIDPITTVKQLTHDVEIELRKRVVVVDESRWHSLTDQIEKIVYTDAKRFGVDASEKNTNWFLARKDIAGTLEYFSTEKLEVLESIEHRVQRYISISELLNLQVGKHASIDKKLKISTSPVLFGLYLILGFPVFICGFLLNIIPFFLTNFLAKTLVRKTDFFGSLILVFGLLLFSINGFLLTAYLYEFTQSTVISLSFLTLLPTFGIFTFKYFIRLKQWIFGLRFRILAFKKESLIHKLSAEREQLLSIFKMGHDEYMASRK